MIARKHRSYYNEEEVSEVENEKRLIGCVKCTDSWCFIKKLSADQRTFRFVDRIGHISQLNSFAIDQQKSFACLFRSFTYSPNEQHVCDPNVIVIIIRARHNGVYCGNLNGCRWQRGRLIIVCRCGIIGFRWELKLNQQLRQNHRHDGFQQCESQHEETINDAARPEGTKESIPQSRLPILLSCFRQLLFPSPAGEIKTLNRWKMLFLPCTHQ